MKALQLRDLVIRPSLELIGLHSKAVEQLLLGTCAQESQMGEYIAQTKGPALGIFQMEPATYNDLLTYINLDKNAALKERILSALFTEVMPGPDALAWNIRLAAIMARLLYLRVPESLPQAGDLAGLWQYYKKNYNSTLGAATREQFVANYNKYVAPLYIE